MGLRNPAATNNVFTFSGLLCLAPAGRTCIAHGLPSVPDILVFSPIAFANNASLHPYAAGLESWDSVSAVFVNSVNFGLITSVVIQTAWEPTR